MLFVKVFFRCSINNIFEFSFHVPFDDSWDFMSINSSNFIFSSKIKWIGKLFCNFISKKLEFNKKLGFISSRFLSLFLEFLSFPWKSFALFLFPWEFFSLSSKKSFSLWSKESFFLSWDFVFLLLSLESFCIFYN